MFQKRCGSGFDSRAVHQPAPAYLRSRSWYAAGVVRKISKTVLMTAEQYERLQALTERSKVPMAIFIREGIDLVLERFEDDKEKSSEKEETKVR